MSNTLYEELEKFKCSKFLNGPTLEAHLKAIFAKLCLENQQDAFKVFENYSYQLKMLGFDPEESETNKMKEPYNQIIEGFQKAPLILNKLNAGTQEEPVEPGQLGYVPNFISEAKMFEMGGIYLTENENYIIQKSITRLCFIKQAKQMRFWGKILGTQKDYYIAEGIPENDENPQGNFPPNTEPKGTGVNKFTYWATNNLFEEWKELPIITPQQIIQSRQIKHIFTGNLEEKVITNPFFFETEKSLLKAQIVRISFSTTIVPKNYFKITEDDGMYKEIEAITEEFKAPTYNELCNLSNWQHFSQNILKEGRIIHMKPEVTGDDDEDKVLKEVEKKDPLEPRLKPLSQDKPLKGFSQVWTLRIYGDPTTYKIDAKIPVETNYGYIIIKSLVWPGMAIAYHQGKWQQLYIGYGNKATTDLFFYRVPDLIQDEPKELLGQPEGRMPPQQDQRQEQKRKNSDDD